MFLHLDDNHVNVDSISYIEHQAAGQVYRIHFNGSLHSPLLIPKPQLKVSESGYGRLREWLASQEAPEAQSVG